MNEIMIITFLKIIEGCQANFQPSESNHQFQASETERCAYLSKSSGIFQPNPL